MTPKKIIIVGTAHPYRGGLAAFNVRLAQQLISEGHNVEVYTFTLQYPNFLFPGKTQFSDDEPPKGVSIFRKINSINPINWIRIGKEIARKQADRVIFCYWMSFMAPCFGTIAKQITPKKTRRVALLHNMIPHEPSLLDKIFPSWFTKQADAYVAMTQSVLRDAQKIDKQNKVSIISPHPIYDHYGKKIDRTEAAKRLNLPDTGKYILFFGIIRAYKGLDLLLEAYAQSGLKEQNVRLIVAGEFYEDSQVYMDIIQKHQMENEVILHTHFIPNDEVAYYFSLADIIAQPYKTATQSGVSQIAYFYEKPMLVTNVGGLSETIPDGKVGYVVEPNSQAVCHALSDFFKNNRATYFAEHIHLEKKKYEWSAMANAVLSV